LRAYNSQLGLLLPRFRLDWIGVNLEDFLRRVLLAAKSAHPENFSYELYPVAKAGVGAGMASTSNSDLAQLYEHNLSRYHILPQERQLIALYRKLNRDAQLPSYPRAWEKVSFHERYLQAGDFPVLNTCFDALMWFFVRHTTRSITATDGLELVRTFFMEPAVLTATDRVQAALERLEPLIRPGFAVFDHWAELAQSAFQPGTRFIITGSDEAPIEGPNTVIASFQDNPLRLELRSYLLETELAQVAPFPERKAELAGRMAALSEARLGAFTETDNQGAEDAA
jgi:hypothetical protein